VDLLVCNLGVVDPLPCVVLKELLEEGHHSRVLHHPLHRYIVILVPDFYFFQDFHSHLPLLTGLSDVVLHEIREGFAEILGDVLGVSLAISMPSAASLLEQAHLLRFASSEPLAGVRTARVPGVVTGGDKGPRLSDVNWVLGLVEGENVDIFDYIASALEFDFCEVPNYVVFFLFGQSRDLRGVVSSLGIHPDHLHNVRMHAGPTAQSQTFHHRRRL
jgi:hypothetical protein